MTADIPIEHQRAAHTGRRSLRDECTRDDTAAPELRRSAPRIEATVMLANTLRPLGHTFRTATRVMVAAAALGSLMVGCSGTAGTVSAPTASKSGPSPTALREFSAPPQYKVWWELTKSCSSVSRDVSGVRWFATADTAIRTSEDGASGVAGEWTAASNSIQLVQDRVNDGAVVRHEMLHALLVAGGHPADKFGADCAGYVSCVGSCARAVGDAPLTPASAPRVTTSALIITQRIVPARIDLASDPDGWFALIVEVKNPRPYAVWVRLAPFPGRAETAATFGYAAASMSQQSYVTGNSIAFLPGETKRVVFDLKAREYIAANRTPTIRGFFNADTLPLLTLNIVP